ncbi:putative oxidoreductase [Jatrophihabitans endophyticus]|uniref:Putative oxidoreductase n=1 Tax=Jatrophihabitans endophyticus TaxID=1206085 RepID=A0A1M5TXY2_9ACTN|nr:DoxX family protein [Jatrophihabitans endophyticus]SHH55544.1 putative oxidoreductase [Jatrophihabitans endophyticus]
MAATATPTTDRADATPTPRTRGRFSEHDLGLLAIRVIAGVVFIAHGGQKLFGWFNGNGLTGTAQFFESAGYSPGKPLAFLAGLAELGGGALLIVGLGTSFAGAALIATMAGATAVKADAGKNAFFAMNSGYEYELLLTVLALGITLVGAGRLSIDHGRPWDRGVVRYALAAGGIVVGIITVLVR